MPSWLPKNDELSLEMVRTKQLHKLMQGYAEDSKMNIESCNLWIQSRIIQKFMW